LLGGEIMKKVIITILFLGSANNSIGMEQPAAMQDISGTDSEIVEINGPILQTSNNADLQQGIKHLDNSKYDRARRSFEKAAQSNDAFAQAEAWYRLGELYRDGKGVARKNLQQARLFWEKASNQFQNKAAQAWSFAQLGDLYIAGEGVPVDLHKAQQYLETARAIDLDDKELQSFIEESLGKLEEQRIATGNFEHLPEFERAASSLSAMRTPTPMQVSEEGNGFASIAEQLMRLKTPSPVEQKAAAEQLAGTDDLDLGNKYYVGSGGFPQNYALALKHYEKAAQSPNMMTNASAWLMLAEFYKRGHGVPQDSSKARGYYIAAAQQNENRFARAVGQMEMGMMQPALEYFATIADEQGNTSEQQYARLVLGQHYMEDTAERDVAKARQYLQDVAQHAVAPGIARKATEYLQQLESFENRLRKQQSEQATPSVIESNFEPAADYNLGIQYYQGLGVPVDLQKARYYLKKAAQQETYPGIMNIAHQALRQIEQQTKIASAAKRPAAAEEVSSSKRSREK